MILYDREAISECATNLEASSYSGCPHHNTLARQVYGRRRTSYFPSGNRAGDLQFSADLNHAAGGPFVGRPSHIKVLLIS